LLWEYQTLVKHSALVRIGVSLIGESKGSEETNTWMGQSARERVSMTSGRRDASSQTIFPAEATKV